MICFVGCSWFCLMILCVFLSGKLVVVGGVNGR